MRRLRMKPFIRNLVSETLISSNDLIWPVFLVEGENQNQKIKSMPFVYRYSIDKLIKELEILVKYGLQAVALFPQIEKEINCFGKEWIDLVLWLQKWVEWQHLW